MNKQQMAIVNRVRRAMKDAKAAGLVTFCDMHVWGIRFVPETEIQRDEDPRDLGETVECSDDHVSAPPEAGETVACESACNTPFNNCAVM